METTTAMAGGPFGVEILEIYVPSGIPNAVRLGWGQEQRQRDNVNLTYGVFFGVEESELECKLIYKVLPVQVGEVYTF